MHQLWLWLKKPLEGVSESIWLKAILSALLFGAAAWAGIEFSRFGTRIATLWPANGLLLAILITGEKREYIPRLLLAYIANAITNLLTGDPAPVAFILAACNSLEIMCALLLMRAHAAESWATLEKPLTLLTFAVYVCVLSPAMAAGLAAVAMTYLTGANAPATFMQWFMADMMGLVIVTPPAVILRRAGFRNIFKSDHMIDDITAMLIVLTVAFAVFLQSRYPLLYLIFPALIYITFVGGYTGASICVFGVALMSIACTKAGMGPMMLIPDASPRERILLLQMFLLVSVLTVFFVAAVMGERRRVETKLKETILTDTLTGLPNRARFQEVIAREWMNARRSQSPLSIAMLDVDFFKRYNDSYGHLSGDDCLAAVGRVLGEAVHRPADLVARYGGEEFILVLPDTQTAGAIKVADCIHRALEKAHLEHRGSPHGTVTVSIGISTIIPEAGSVSADLIAAADRALYGAKKAGRARTEIADCEVPASAPESEASDAKVLPMRYK